MLIPSHQVAVFLPFGKSFPPFKLLHKFIIITTIYYPVNWSSKVKHIEIPNTIAPLTKTLEGIEYSALVSYLRRKWSFENLWFCLKHLKQI